MGLVNGDTMRTERRLPVPPELHRAGYRRVAVSPDVARYEDRRGIVIDWMGPRGLELLVRSEDWLERPDFIGVALQAAHDELRGDVWTTGAATDTGELYRCCEIRRAPDESVAADAALAAEVTALAETLTSCR